VFNTYHPGTTRSEERVDFLCSDERRLFFEILFEDAQQPSWEEAQSCLDTLARKQLERELGEVQRGIEANPSGQALKELLTRKQDLMRRLAASG